MPHFPLLLLAALAAALRAELFRAVGGPRLKPAPSDRAHDRPAPPNLEPAPAPEPRRRRSRSPAGARSPSRPAWPRVRSCWRSVPLRRAPNGRVVARARTQHRVRGSARDDIATSAGAGWAWSATEMPNGKLAWVTSKNTGPPLPAGRLLAPRRPVRPLARAAQGRPALRRIAVAIGARDRRHHRPLRGHRQASAAALRALLRLLHPRPERPPAEAPGRLDGRQPLAIHGTNSPGTICAPPRRDAFAPRIRTSKSLMRRVPLGTPVSIKN